jgi:hypothetical protein
MKRYIRRPSPALVVAMLALVVAMSGTAFAVTQNGDTLITPRTLSGDRLRLNTVTGGEITNLGWGGIILQNGWAVGTRHPEAAVDVQGIVHLKGVVTGNGTAATIGTLPKSAAPTSPIYLTARNNKGATVGIILQSTGSIVVQGTLGPNMHISLDGLTYAR